MKKTVLFLRSQLPKTDSRLQRYLFVLNNQKINYHIIGWARNKENQINKHETLYYRHAKIGSGIKNIINLIRWNGFILTHLLKKRKSYTHIHAVDFDTIIPSLIVAKLLKKQLIFDIYDKYTDSRHVPKVILFFIDRVELLGCKLCSHLLLPDICRKQQLNLPKDIKATIIENVPIASSTTINDNNIKKHNIQQKNTLSLSYVGILESEHRGLEDLLNVVSKKPNIILNIAGDGPLKKTVEEYTNQYNNIIYHDAVDPSFGLKIMSNSDIIVGMYYKSIKNHLFASPNKYYEHLMLGKAMLTTIGTPPADKVLKYNTGYAIDEGTQKINELLDKISIEEIVKKGKNAKKHWKNHYEHYTESYLNDTYTKLIKN